MLLALLSGLVGTPPQAAAQTHFAGTAGSGSGAGEFVLSAGDLVRVRVWPDSLLGGDFPIEDSGVVHLPLLGAVDAAGKTVQQLRKELRSGYGRDLQLPVVSLTPLFRVSVLGAVRSPGVYWIDPGYGLFELISEAGGATDRARHDGVQITRRGRRSRIDATLPGPGRTPSEVALRSGDRVLVSEARRISWFAALQGLTLVVSVATLVVR